MSGGAPSVEAIAGVGAPAAPLPLPRIARATAPAAITVATTASIMGACGERPCAPELPGYAAGGVVADAARPHSGQNFAAGSREAPQPGQVVGASAAPQLLQNRPEAAAPQEAQVFEVAIARWIEEVSPGPESSARGMPSTSAGCAARAAPRRTRGRAG